jgi:hypothetical protein
LKKERTRMISLSPEQQRAFGQGNPVRVHDPGLGGDAVVCPAGVFERMEAQLREMAEDDKEQDAWLKMSMRSLALRLEEDEND